MHNNRCICENSFWYIVQRPQLTTGVFFLIWTSTFCETPEFITKTEKKHKTITISVYNAALSSEKMRLRYFNVQNCL